MHEQLVAVPTRLNYQDFCALPEDGKRYEILDGNLYTSPSSRTLHQRVVLNLAFILSEHVRRHHLGEVFIAPYDVVLSEHDIVEPDIIFVAGSNSSIVTEDNIRGVPDLLIEVMSTSRPELDTRDKRNVYERCGVPFYWIVDPQLRRILELRQVEKAYADVSARTDQEIFRSQLFPQLAIELNRIWA